MTQRAATMPRRSCSPWSATARSDHARRLLVAGLVGGHAAGLVVGGLAWAWHGPRAGASAAIAAAVTIAFFAVGQGVQLVVAEADPRRVLAAAMASYLLRVTVLGLLLALAMRSERVSSVLDTGALFAGVVTTVIGWLAAEMVAFSRLRIPVYDTEYVAPEQPGTLT